MKLSSIPVLCLALFATSFFGQHDPSKTVTTFYPAKPVPGVVPSPPPMDPMPGIAPLFIQGGGFDSTLVLVNDASVNVGATITLRALDGHQLVQKRIVLEKTNRLSLRVSTLLQDVQESPILGSLTVLQDMKVTGMVVAAQLTIQDERFSTSAYIDEELGMPAMNGSSTLRAVSDPAEGPALLAITNLAGSVQHVSLTCLEEKRKRVSISMTLPAFATSLSSACSNKKIDSIAEYNAGLDESKQQRVQGFEATGDGMPGMLAAFALAPHTRREARVFSGVPFVDPKSLISQNTIYVGVPVGAQSVLADGIYVPRLALANFSTQPAHITIETSSSEPQEPKDDTETTDAIIPKVLNVLLKAGESKDVLIYFGSSSSGLQHSVLVKNDRLPGEVQTKLVSRSDGLLYEVEMLAKDEKTPQNGGGHPWLTRGETDSHLLLFNHSANVKTVTVSIANGLTIWKKLYRIAALDTRQLSINQIIHDKIQDNSGKTLDPKYQAGVVLWSTANPGDITGRLLVSSRASAMAHNFSCGNVLVICGMGLSVFDGGSVPLNYYSDYGAIEPQYCWAWGPGQCSSSYPASGGSASFYWSLGNTGIVNFNTSGDQYNSSPNFKGVKVGSTYTYAQATENGCTSSGPGNPSPSVNPTVTISGPTSVPMLAAGAQGVDSIQLTATGVPAGGTYSWTILGGNGSVTLANSNQQTVIVQSRAEGSVTIQVNYLVGGGTGFKQIGLLVQKPAHLAIVSDPPLTFNCRTLAPDFPPYTGPQRSILYQVTDSTGRPIAASGMRVAESFVPISDNCQHVNPVPAATSGQTLSNGFFNAPDTLAMCSISCLPANSTDHPLGSCLLKVSQTWAANGFPVQTKSLNYSCTSIVIQ